MGLHCDAAVDAGDLIRVAGALHALFARFTRFRLVAIFEALQNADNEPMLIPHQHHPDVDRNRAASFVTQMALVPLGCSALDRSPDRTRPAYYLVAKVPRDAFGAVAPQNDFLKVDHWDRSNHPERLPKSHCPVSGLRLQEMNAVRHLNPGSGVFSIR
jgi:hypothetical protein